MGKDPQIPAAPPPDSVQNSDPGQEQADSPASDEETSRLQQDEPAGESEGEDEEEVARDSKRRRLSCPSALDTCPPDGHNSGAGLSFSFDTKIQPMYSTPKFGSFCLGLDFGPPDLGDPSSVRSPEGFGVGEEEVEAGIGLEVETRVGVAAVDGGEGAGE